jgi:hypothetical protein
MQNTKGAFVAMRFGVLRFADFRDAGPACIQSPRKMVHRSRLRLRRHYDSNTL